MQEANIDVDLTTRANDIFEKSNSLLKALNGLNPLSLKAINKEGILKIFEVNG